MSEENPTAQPVSQQTRAEPSQIVTPGDGSSVPPKLTGAALWVAIFALLAWIGFSIFLIAKAGTNETEWTRIAWVFGSIQAIAFAAAGALFGTAVQQQNVSNAQQQATSAKKDADQQREAATKGNALAATLQAQAVALPTGGADGLQRAGVGGAARSESADELRQSYAQLSRALFGDLI